MRFTHCKRALTFTLLAAVAATFSLAARPVAAQQQTQGPMEPPPEHKVTRITGVAEPEAPPSLAPAQIIHGFTQKEDLYLSQRPLYSYRKSIRIQEFGPDGKASGEFTATYEAERSSDGKYYEKAISPPESTLVYLQADPDQVQQLTRLPNFPVTTAQLAKYDVQFLSTETVDEIDCYIFQVKPKILDRKAALFDGIIWVDQKYLEVVKTYGKWVTDLGEMHPMSLPFGIFETYRENVDGKYWFPNYTRSDGTLQLKDREIPVRITIKWTNYKPYPAAAVTTTPPASVPAQQNGSPSPANTAAPAQQPAKP